MGHHVAHYVIPVIIAVLLAGIFWRLHSDEGKIMPALGMGAGNFGFGETRR